ncbi:PIN domain-containing protein [Bradyrhizobium sp.]|uniref:PIN domain-containing protein n=1 Tax=Bradyrhizobium sp. TaxID=376 RepID=UPI003C56E93C
MTGEGGVADSDREVLRVSLDVNIWIAHLLALQHGRKGAATELVGIVRDMTSAAGPIQLVMSWEMIATLEDVLGRLQFDAQSISDFTSSLILLMKSGPEAFDPHLLPESGRQLAMKDDEDAAVLASAIAARVDLLVTNNLEDFVIKESERIKTRGITLGHQPAKQLAALIYERNDGVGIVVAHPIDALTWLTQGLRPSPKNVRSLGARSSPKP